MCVCACVYVCVCARVCVVYVQVDFSPMGKLLACLLVVAGVGLYAIPVGACFYACSYYPPLSPSLARALFVSRSRARSLAFSISK